MLSAVPKGDLAGYDDALYAHMAKGIAHSGQWLNVQSNGYPELEHPPLLAWMEAGLFLPFGPADSLAKLPSAVCGLGVILLVYVLARKLLGDETPALAAMLVMASTLYFLKYASRAMTDVPFTFFFLAAICAWVYSEKYPSIYLAVGLATGLALITRGLMGFALPVIFAIHAVITRRRPALRWVLPSAIIAILPLALWYAHMLTTQGAFFINGHMQWLSREVYGPLSPSWRRYTGLFEYAWMLTKSYWPWLPFTVAGFVILFRTRKLPLLAIWIAVTFIFCAAARSRVLRYLLPAYPAFAVLAAIGLERLLSAAKLRFALNIAIPVFGIIAFAVAIFKPSDWHASEIRPIANMLSLASPQEERVAFYDAGQPRFDETNQLQWYSSRYLNILLSRDELAQALCERRSHVFVVDEETYRSQFRLLMPVEWLGQSGHLVCVRLTDKSTE